MFSNKLVRSLCKSSEEDRLKLSPLDWEIVLSANKAFTESESDHRGSELWGKYLIGKLGDEQSLAFSNSLELCCGNGFLYFSLSKDYELADHCHFIDLSYSQCAYFKKRSQVSKMPHILCGDIGKLPFRDGTLKLVYGNSFLHHLPDVLEYLKETCRVLEDGGRFVAFHEPTQKAQFWESFPISLYKNTATDSLTDIWLISPKVIETLLREAGFSKVRIYPNNLLSSLLVVPFQLVLAKLHLPYNFDAIVKIKMVCDKIEVLLPKSIRLKYSPSLAICAEK